MTHSAGSSAAVRVHRVAATVVLLRDGPDGPEVLMLERPGDRGSFAGAWVFPGGGVDEADGLSGEPAVHAVPGEEAAARRAAVREVREETALELTPDALALVSCWTPPASAPRRFRTWFYYAQAPNGSVALSPQESVGFRWIRPASALGLQAAGRLQLVPPTWVTLHALAAASASDTVTNTAAAIVEQAGAAAPREYATHIASAEHGRMLLWQGDVAYVDERLFNADGPRNRLDTGSLPWGYSLSV